MYFPVVTHGEILLRAPRALAVQIFPLRPCASLARHSFSAGGCGRKKARTVAGPARIYAPKHQRQKTAKIPYAGICSRFCRVGGSSRNRKASAGTVRRAAAFPYLQGWKTPPESTPCKAPEKRWTAAALLHDPHRPPSTSWPQASVVLGCLGDVHHIITFHPRGSILALAPKTHPFSQRY